VVFPPIGSDDIRKRKSSTSLGNGWGLGPPLVLGPVPFTLGILGPSTQPDAVMGESFLPDFRVSSRNRKRTVPTLHSTMGGASRYTCPHGLASRTDRDAGQSRTVRPQQAREVQRQRGGQRHSVHLSVGADGEGARATCTAKLAGKNRPKKP
jgi:hypothetical protein